MLPEEQVEAEDGSMFRGMNPSTFRSLFFPYLNDDPETVASLGSTSRFFNAVCYPERLPTFISPKPTPLATLQDSVDISSLQLTDNLLKVVVLGELSLAAPFVKKLKDAINPEFSFGTRTTIGVEFALVNVPFGEERLRLQVWDLSSNIPRLLLPSYLKAAKIIYHCCDMKEPDSVEKLKASLESTEAYRKQNPDVIAMMIVKNRKFCSYDESESLYALALRHNVEALHGFSDEPDQIVKTFNVGLRFWLDQKSKPVNLGWLQLNYQSMREELHVLAAREQKPSLEVVERLQQVLSMLMKHQYVFLESNQVTAVEFAAFIQFLEMLMDCNTMDLPSLLATKRTCPDTVLNLILKVVNAYGTLHEEAKVPLLIQILKFSEKYSLFLWNSAQAPVLCAPILSMTIFDKGFNELCDRHASFTLQAYTKFSSADLPKSLDSACRALRRVMKKCFVDRDPMVIANPEECLALARHLHAEYQKNENNLNEYSRENFNSLPALITLLEAKVQATQAPNVLSESESLKMK